MEFFFNVTTSPMELPRPNGQGTRIIGPGEGFYGPAYYNQYVLSGQLAKANWGSFEHNVFVSATDLIDTTASQSATIPYRYKNNIADTISSIGQRKFSIRCAYDARPEDPALITYYFYTDLSRPTEPSFVISRVGVVTNDWRFPTWAKLPDDFYSLDPLKQRDALLRTQ